MMQRDIVTIALHLVIGLVILPTETLAQPFLDDFEDNNVTDGDPVTWGRYSYTPEGDWEVSDGNFIFRPTTLATDPSIAGVNAYVEGHVYKDFSLRTQFRALTTNPYWVGFVARHAYSDDGTVGTEIFTHLDLSNGGGAAIGYLRDDETHDDAIYLNRMPVSFSAFNSDVNLRLDLTGRMLEFYAWPDGEAMPNAPTVSAVAPDFLADEGEIGIWYQTWSNLGAPPVAFRYVEVVPEPTSAVLAFLGLSGLGILGRRRRARLCDGGGM